MLVYKYTNKINGKTYIGITTRKIESRHAEHLKNAGDGTYFHNAIAKYGIETFSLEIIDTAKTRKELQEKEQYWIKQYNSFAYWKDSCGYNETTGGEGMTGHFGELNSQYGVFPQQRMSPEKLSKWKESLNASARRGEDHYCYGKHPREWAGENAWNKNVEAASKRWLGASNPSVKNPKIGKDNYNYQRKYSQAEIDKIIETRHRKISSETADEIRRLYMGGKHLQKEIAEMYGVTRQTIGDIVTGRTFAYMPNDYNFEQAKLNNENRRTQDRKKAPKGAFFVGNGGEDGKAM